MKDIRCILCSEEFDFKLLEEQCNKEGKDIEACPKCGHTGTPMSINQDTQVKINWHELRCLTIWASNYGKTLDASSRKALKAIIDRLTIQRKEGWGALTIEEEFREFQEHYPNSQLVSNDGKVIIDKKFKN